MPGRHDPIQPLRVGHPAPGVEQRRRQAVRLHLRSAPGQPGTHCQLLPSTTAEDKAAGLSRLTGFRSPVSLRNITKNFL